MSIKDFYAAVGGSYDEIMRRLLSEERVVKYLGKFCNDKSYELMTKDIAEEKWEDAFRDAHNLKGISVNQSCASQCGTESLLWISSPCLTG